jgi:hypothetical protein
MTPATALLAALVGITLLVGQLVAFGAVGDASLAGDRGWMVVGTVGMALPWLVGAALLVVRVRLGVAVLATVAVLTVPVMLLGWVLTVATQLLGLGTLGWGLAPWSAVLLNLVLVAAMGSVGWLAWQQAPPRFPVPPRPPVHPAYAAAAVAAASGLVLETTTFRTPSGALWSFLPTVFHFGPDLTVLLSMVVVLLAVAAVLLTAPALEPAVGGAVVLTYVVPTLLTEGANLGRAAASPELAIAPTAVLVGVGLVVLGGFGLRWVREGRARTGAATVTATA